jgi:hypothetical protein
MSQVALRCLSWLPIAVVAAAAILPFAGTDTLSARSQAEGPGGNAARCGALASLALPDTAVKQASVVSAGTFARPSGRGNAAFAELAPFCRVAMTLSPSADSNIGVEVWLA